MAFSNKTLILAFFLILTYTAHSQTTSFTYDFYGEKPTTLDYQGDAHFASDTTHLRLTKTDNNGNALQTSIGRAVYSDPIPFWAPGKVTDFETTIKFIINQNSNDNNPADGIAFFIAPVGTTIPTGGGGGSFGVFGASGNSSSVFAAEFDIYVNGAWDPSYRHIGIDIESRKSVATSPISDSMIGQEVTMRVNYVGATHMISVVATAGSQRYEVSYEYDLTSVLPQQVQVGVSASTGENVAVHEVISWYLTSTLLNSKKQSIRQFWN